MGWLVLFGNIECIVRQLQCRAAERMVISVKTLVQPSTSGIKILILRLCKEHKHEVIFNSFNIITKANNIDLRFFELVFIYKNKPNFNEGLPVKILF